MQATAPRTRFDLALTALLALLIVLSVVLPQVRAVYPFTYDELVYLRKTRAYDQWLREGLAQARQGHPGWMLSAESVMQAEQLQDMHPGFVKLVGLLPHWGMQAVLHKEGGARMTGALFLALAACALYWLLAPRAGRLLAFSGAVGFALLPRLFGHAHFHALDVPVMAMIFIAMLAFRKAAREDRWSTALWAGIIGGCAVATKLNAVALLPVMALWLSLYRPPGWKKTLACGLIMSPVVFFALWPWLWHDLPGKLNTYFSFHQNHFHVPVLYLGHVYGLSENAPAVYPLVIVAVSLPVVWLLLTLTGLVQAARRRDELRVLLALGLVSSLALAMLPGAQRYNGERLFMPVFVFAAALSILAAHALAQRLRHPLVVPALALLLALPNAVGVAQYYPYCLSYYSEVAGGLRGAERLGFEVTYWGDAYYAAAPTMAAPENQRKEFVAAHEFATGVLDALIQAGIIPPERRMYGRFVRDSNANDADWLIADNWQAGWSPAVKGYASKHEPQVLAQRQGVPLAWLYRLQ
ncbi:MAG: ArnT family glycosyltransferase [Armatimonadota bacterium]